MAGRLDFKGTARLDIEIEAFSAPSGIESPAGQTMSERLAKIFTELRRRAQSTLLVFDTYEAAGEAKDWVERGASSVPRSTLSWLRVVIIGQSAPTRVGSIWESVAASTLTMQLPGPEDWLGYGRVNRGQTP